MRKRSRRGNYKRSNNVHRSRLRPSHVSGSLLWAFIAALCFIVFLGVFSMVNASQAGNQGPVPKQQVLSQLAARSTKTQSKSTDQEPVTTVQPAPTLQAGIIDMQQGPFHSSVFTVRNFWQGPISRDWILAYAGGKTNTNGTVGAGGIVLYTETANQSGGFDLHPLGTFLASNGISALTITAVNGSLMQLRSDSGSTLTFDLQTRQFN